MDSIQCQSCNGENREVIEIPLVLSPGNKIAVVIQCDKCSKECGNLCKKLCKEKKKKKC